MNFRNLDRIKNAIEQYDSGLISLQSLIGDLQFLSSSIDCIDENDLIPLNRALMDLESVNSSQIEGEFYPQMEKIISDAIHGCNLWIQSVELKIKSD